MCFLHARQNNSRRLTVECTALPLRAISLSPSTRPSNAISQFCIATNKYRISENINYFLRWIKCISQFVFLLFLFCILLKIIFSHIFRSVWSCNSIIWTKIHKSDGFNKKHLRLFLFYLATNSTSYHGKFLLIFPLTIEGFCD